MNTLDWIESPKRCKDVKQTLFQYKELGIEETLDLYMCNVGKKVTKVTSSIGSQPKPFKSGFKINTVKDVVVHPILLTPAYIFEEDVSYVECRKCYVVEKY